ncbi:MAG: DUF4330 family protein [Clostridiaceae bacterium]|nr:DUF4330 family protein [Clostridiaceae bacterium]
MKHKFGKADFIIIILVVAAIATGVYLFQGKRTQSVADTKTLIEFDILVLDLTQQQAEGFKNGVGTNVVVGNTNIDTGILKDVKTEPYLRLTKDILNGKLKWVAHPENLQATLTIQKQVSQTNDVFVGDKEEIRIGELTPVKGKGFGSAGCYVTDLRIVGGALDEKH